MLLLFIRLSQLLGWLILVPIVIAPAIALARWQQLGRVQRCLATLVWFELPLELLASTFAFLKRNNLFIMPIYTVGELCLLALVYREALQSAVFSRWAPWVAGAFAAYVGLDCLLAPNLHWYQTAQQVTQGLLILSMVGLYFRKLLHELRVRRLRHEPMMWVSAGLVVYFLVYFQIVLFSNYMLQHYSLQFNRNVWAAHSFVAIVLHTCYCVALALAPTASATPQPRRQRHATAPPPRGSLSAITP